MRSESDYAPKGKKKLIENGRDAKNKNKKQVVEKTKVLRKTTKRGKAVKDSSIESFQNSVKESSISETESKAKNNQIKQ